MSSPQRTASQDSTADGIRKRVCKACDRCRLKKSKCDGSNPCSRCKADNAICVFGERKKSHDKVYPKGYVEMLEQQQSQLVSGLQEMYKRLQAAGAWNGEELNESNGHPLTHDILAALDLLEVKHDGSGEVETFEEDCSKLQSRLISEGAGFAQRRDSISSDSEHSQGHERTDSKPSVFRESFNFSAPPTPPPLEHSPAPVARQQTSYPRNEPSPLQQSSPPLTGDPQFFEAPWSYAAMQNPDQFLRSKFAMQAPELDPGMQLSEFENFQQWNVAPEQRFDEKIDYNAMPAPAVWPHHLGSYANMPRLQEGGLAMSMDPMVDVEFNQFLSICT